MSRQIVSETGGLALQADLCLLICNNMFPEGSKIPIDDIVIIGMGLKLFEDVPNLFEVRKRVLLLIETIRYRHGISGFRVEKDENDKQYVTLLTASYSFLKRLAALRNQFMYEPETVIEYWVDMNGYEHCRGLSLVLKRIRGFLGVLNCPKLDVLRLKYGEDSVALPFDFFQGMKELRVLSLNVPSLPHSLNMLRNLRTLHLKVIDAINMSVIGGLVNLEFLSVSTSSSADIPRVMGQLEKLRLLDLRNMIIAYISQGVFSRMLKLEELYLPLSFNRWGCRAKEKENDIDEWESGEEDCYGDEERVNASLNEILVLPLNALQICIPDTSLLPKESPAFRTIRQFRIIGPDNLLYWPFGNGSMNMLQLTGDVCDIKGSGVCNLIWRTEHLSLTRVKNLKSLACHLEDHHFPWLKEMIISECDEVEYIIDLKEKCIPFTFLWVLKSLHLSMLPNLKQIWRGTHIGWFQSLRQINIRFCHKLKYVFPMSMASELRNVHSIEILDCDEMEGVFNAGVDDYLYGFYSLEELYLHSLPKLVGFLVEKDYASEEVYDNSTQSLTVSETASNSTYLERQSSGPDVNSQPTTKGLWNNKLLLSTDNIVHSKQVSPIKNKDVNSHMEMNCAFSSELLVKRRIEKLKKLRIAFCDAIRVIFWCNAKRKHRFTGVLNSLSELELLGLQNLVHIWFQVPSETMAFLNLQLLVLVDCNNLYLFTPLVANLLVLLKKIQISRCEMMEEIVSKENKRKVDEIVFPQLKALELQHMPKLRMFYRGNHAIELPLLDTLKLNQCSKMEAFSRGSLRTPVLERIQLNGSTSSTGRDLNATIKAWKANAY